MKKARIILTVIAIFTIAGGAFAFKANRQTDKIYAGCELGQFPSTYLTGLRITVVSAAGITSFATSTYTLPCGLTKITFGL